MAYVKTTWSTGDVITATALNNLETQHEKILGEANSYTATPTFTTGQTTSTIAMSNARDTFRNATSSGIYATLNTGAAYPFNQAGHLVLEPRFSGATRDVVMLKSDGTANAIFYGAGGAQLNGTIEANGLSTTGSLVFMIDSDNNGGELFALRANGGASNVFYINETGGGLFRDQIYQTGSAATYYAEGYSTATETAPAIRLDRANSGTVGTKALVANGQRLGSINFTGANGTSYDSAAQIRAYVDGTPSASNDMPGRLSFWTTPDGTVTPVERLRLNNGGSLIQIGTGTMPSTPAVNGQSVTVLKELYSTGSVGLQMHRESADANSARMIFMKRRSGYGTAVVSGDQLGYIQFDGASTDSGATDTGAAIRAEATGTWTTTSYPSKVIISAVDAASTSLNDTLTVNPTNISVAGSVLATGGINPNASGGQTLSKYISTTATCNYSGMTTAASVTLYYVIIGNLVSLKLAPTTFTSNATTMTLTGLPAELQPSYDISIPIIVIDNGTNKFGRAVFGASSTVTFYSDAGTGAFTNSGTKGAILVANYTLF